MTSSYPALRTISAILKVNAWVIIVFDIIAIAVAIATNPPEKAGAVALACVGLVVFSAFIVLMLFAYSEAFRLAVEIAIDIREIRVATEIQGKKSLAAVAS